MNDDDAGMNQTNDEEFRNSMNCAIDSMMTTEALTERLNHNIKPFERALIEELLILREMVSDLKAEHDLSWLNSI